jgi:hypothetical protein
MKKYDMGQASRHGLKELSTRANGLTDKRMEGVSFGMQMGIFTMAIGKVTRPVGMGNITTLTVRNLKEIGRTIDKMDLELRFKWMGASTRVGLKKE